MLLKEDVERYVEIGRLHIPGMHDRLAGMAAATPRRRPEWLAGRLDASRPHGTVPQAARSAPGQLAGWSQLQGGPPYGQLKCGRGRASPGQLRGGPGEAGISSPLCLFLICLLFLLFLF